MELASRWGVEGSKGSGLPWRKLAFQMFQAAILVNWGALNTQSTPSWRNNNVNRASCISNYPHLDHLFNRLCAHYGPLNRYVKLRVAYAPGMPGTFSSPPTSKKTASQRSRHASRHVRHARPLMHVGIANPQWQGKRFRYSQRVRNPQFYVSGKRPMSWGNHVSASTYPKGTAVADWSDRWKSPPVFQDHRWLYNRTVSRWKIK